MAVINREALIQDYKLSQSRKDEEDIGFTWVVKANQISLVNWREMASQINIWKNKKSEVRANDYNNKEFEFEGKKWYVLIAQIYTNGEMDEDANIMCPISLMLFGTMVSGMTYAFETKEQRDEFFDGINAKHLYILRDTDTKKEHPICGLCGKWCECPHGHNPYPLLGEGRRVCGKCNAEAVIPARRKGVRRSEDLKTNQDDYDTFLGGCLQPLNDGIFQLEQELLDGEKMLPLDTDFPEDIKVQYNKCYDERERLFIKANKEVSKYIKERLDRQLKVRCIVEPEGVLLTAGSAIHQSIARELNENVLARLRLIEEYKFRLECELIHADAEIAPQQEKAKTKAELKKEQTRNANKTKAEEKKLKEEQDKAQAQAQFQAEQQRKQKAKAIAIKKQKAIIAEAERHLERLKAEGV